MNMASKVNVLVYTGPGTTVESVKHCLFSLRRILSPNYAVIPVNGETLTKEPWSSTCALLCIPGGADLGYCRALNGAGNSKILQYIRRGGSYLGLCAGGYYGSSQVEFEVGDKQLEVVGKRELQFYPGLCRGAAFKGFVYDSEAGAKASRLEVLKENMGSSCPDNFRVYFNGGGVFVDAAKYKDKGVEILARYADKLEVDGGDGNAAVIHCKVGSGNVLLTGVHPEFAAVNLDPSNNERNYRQLVEDLAADDKMRTQFFKSCLEKLGLNVNHGSEEIPSLSKLHLTSISPSNVKMLVDDLQDIVTHGSESSAMIIKGESNTFVLERPQSFAENPGKTEDNEKSEKQPFDVNDQEMCIQVHDATHPTARETPYFNHDFYYDSLKLARRQTQMLVDDRTVGSNLLYSEVTTSTNSILDKNFKLLQRLPRGFTSVGTIQIAGRGRGSNVWVSPIGSLAFSTCLRHNWNLFSTAPVIFVQYLAALAIVEAVKEYGPGYDEVPVKLKWPNDIYAENPAKSLDSKQDYVKIGGILVNSSFANNEYLLVVGCGVNATNKAPTTSLNLLLDKVNESRRGRNLQALPPFQIEKLLAKILVTFEDMYTIFSNQGFRPFERLYYSRWLHSNQIVRLDMEAGARAKIRGISMDDGLLQANEVDASNNETGRQFTLQTDNNSFDFFQGLLKKKV